MGVTKLWQLLAPCGSSCSLESLENKRLAIDASIWMVQFISAMVDKNGEPVMKAHLKGLFYRVCKLLFFGIKPVFVFDGAVPAIKQNTRERRRLIRHKKEEKEEAQRRKEVLKRHIQSLHFRQTNQGKVHEGTPGEKETEKGPTGVQREGPLSTSSGSDIDEYCGDDVWEEMNEVMAFDEHVGIWEPIYTVEHRNAADPYGDLFRKKEEIDLTNDEENSIKAEKDEYTVLTKKQLPHFFNNAKALPASYQLSVPTTAAVPFPSSSEREEQAAAPYPRGSVHAATEAAFVHAGVLSELPPELQLQLLEEIKVANRIEAVERVKSASNKDLLEFSKAQVINVLKANTISKRVDKVQNQMAVSRSATQPSIASDPSREFYLLQEVQDPTMGRKSSTSGHSATIKLEDDEEETAPLPSGASLVEKVSQGETRSERRQKRMRTKRWKVLAGTAAGTFVTDQYDIMEEQQQTQVGHASSSAEVAHHFLQSQTVGGEEDAVKGDTGGGFLPHEHAGAAIAQDENNGFLMLSSDSKDEEDTPKGNDTHDTRNASSKSARGSNTNEVEEQEESETGKEDNDNCAGLSGKEQGAPRTTSLWGAAAVGVPDTPLLESLLVSTKRFDRAKKEKQREGKKKEKGKERAKEDATHRQPSPKQPRKRGREPNEPERGAAPVLQITVIPETQHKKKRKAGEGTSTTEAEDNVSRIFDNIFKKERQQLEESKRKQEQRENSSLRSKRRMQRRSLLAALEEEDHKKQKGEEPPYNSTPSATLLEGTSLFPTDAVVSDAGSHRILHQTRPKVPSDKDTAGESGRGGPLEEKTPRATPSSPREHPSSMGQSFPLPAASSPPSSFLRTRSSHAAAIARLRSMGISSANDTFDLMEKEAEQLSSLAKEQQKVTLGKDFRTSSVAHEMVSECKELLSLFGVPFLVAPGEAEAQCAELERLDLVDGIVTDDSDVFLFGGKCVYRNLFSKRKDPTLFTAKSIKNNISLSRNKLVDLAQLLGSDYTEGLHGVGPVTAMEILNEFETLAQFNEWWKVEAKDFKGTFESVGAQLQSTRTEIRALKRKVRSNEQEEEKQREKELAQREQQLLKRHRLMKRRKKFVKLHAKNKGKLPPNFLREDLVQAYLRPSVDSSPVLFTWGKIQLQPIRQFASTYLGWNQDKVDGLVLPVVRQRNLKKRSDHKASAGVQPRLTSYFLHKQTERPKSVRVQKAIEQMLQKAQSGSKKGKNKT